MALAEQLAGRDDRDSCPPVLLVPPVCDRSPLRDQLAERITQRIELPLDARQREQYDDALQNAGSQARIAQRRRRARLDLDQTPAQARIWLHGEALPQGWLDNDQAALTLRAQGLAQASELPAPCSTACCRRPMPF